MPSSFLERKCGPYKRLKKVNYTYLLLQSRALVSALMFLETSGVKKNNLSLPNHLISSLSPKWHPA